MKRVLLLIASAALFAAAPVEAHGNHGGHRHRSTYCHYHWKYDATHCHNERGRRHRHPKWYQRRSHGHGHYYDHRTDLILKFDF